MPAVFKSDFGFTVYPSAALEVESEPVYIAKALTGTSHFTCITSQMTADSLLLLNTRVRIILGYSFNGGFDEKDSRKHAGVAKRVLVEITYAIKHCRDTAPPSLLAVIP